ncbi:unnamed protein product, partial [Discosporangium mesarthrocarpum]
QGQGREGEGGDRDEANRDDGDPAPTTDKGLGLGLGNPRHAEGLRRVAMRWSDTLKRLEASHNATRKAIRLSLQYQAQAQQIPLHNSRPRSLQNSSNTSQECFRVFQEGSGALQDGPGALQDGSGVSDRRPAESGRKGGRVLTERGATLREMVEEYRHQGLLNAGPSTYDQTKKLTIGLGLALGFSRPDTRPPDTAAQSSAQGATGPLRPETTRGSLGAAVGGGGPELDSGTTPQSSWVPRAIVRGPEAAQAEGDAAINRAPSPGTAQGFAGGVGPAEDNAGGGGDSAPALG